MLLVLQTVSQSINFVGNDVTADATAQQGICTVTVDSNIAGINTLHQSYFHDQHITGVTSFISSDQKRLYSMLEQQQRFIRMVI